MNRFTWAAFVPAAVSTVLLLAPNAAAMTPEPDSVQDTVQRLKADGYTVVVNRLGSGPSHACTVSAVRPGQTITRVDSGAPGAGTDSTTTVVSRSVHVEISC